MQQMRIPKANAFFYLITITEALEMKTTEIMPLDIINKWKHLDVPTITCSKFTDALNNPFTSACNN